MSQTPAAPSSPPEITQEKARDILKGVLSYDTESTESIAGRYSDAGVEYEAMLKTLGYSAHKELNEAVTPILKDNYTARILDSGAGSGLVAIELNKLGYKNIDYLDPAEGLMKLAQDRGLYNKYYCQYLGKDPIPEEDGSYDMVVMCGTVAFKLIGASGYLELFRVTKKGGHFINVCREAIPHEDDETFGTFLDKAVKDGRVKLISKQSFPNFLDGRSGVKYVCEIL